ncbi:hypothetical protein NA57DRAFT_55325 [Rhizodiscina lignyota]|uniref:Cytochrome c oxidase assembly factor 3 n=1 Tax=Rhizodiscina lignyota TaxID=1504668 RepID=A0A9P4MB42_9PEZI|nr:hypothetical protein NA57DRAFT_55325 [Rhizodiscina lignyota]
MGPRSLTFAKFMSALYRFNPREALKMVLPRSSYYDREYRQGPALIRARQPYLVKNIITGVCIFSFAIGVYAYTIKAISQDEFEDVKPPPIPAQSTQTPNTSTK